MGTGVNQLLLQNSLSSGEQGGKHDTLSRRSQYRPELEAGHPEQSILKTQHFQISVIHQKQSAETALTPERCKATSL